jgi:hypothetical protein
LTNCFNAILIAHPTSTDLALAPISPDWILSGTPEVRKKLLTKTRDGTSSIMIWECTAGCFNWHYGEDETVVVIAGEVFITTQDGQERRLRQGDIAFFPAGSSCRWRVDDYVKKIAILRKDLPRFLGICVRVWHKLLQITRLRRRSSLMPNVLLYACYAACSAG